jgi:hypothetical protein
VGGPAQIIVCAHHLPSQEKHRDRSTRCLQYYESQSTHKEMNNMRITRNLGMLLLAIWLIAWGLIALIPALSGLSLILAILAIAAGVLILLGR